MRLFNRRPAKRVTLYGKPGCHLCDEALAMLQRLERRYPMEIQKVDITQDPTLFRRYDIRIPVVVVDGGDEMEAPITEQELRRSLR